MHSKLKNEWKFFYTYIVDLKIFLLLLFFILNVCVFNTFHQVEKLNLFFLLLVLYTRLLLDSANTTADDRNY